MPSPWRECGILNPMSFLRKAASLETSTTFRYIPFARSKGPPMKSVLAALFAAAVGCALVRPVFSAQGAGAKEKVLYSFCSQANCTDGETPFGNALAIKGILYGTTD